MGCAVHGAQLRRPCGDANRVPFALHRVPREGRGHQARIVTLHMHIGPGDDAEPVITIMQPTED